MGFSHERTRVKNLHEPDYVRERPVFAVRRLSRPELAQRWVGRFDDNSRRP